MVIPQRSRVALAAFVPSQIVCRPAVDVETLEPQQQRSDHALVQRSKGFGEKTVFQILPNPESRVQVTVENVARFRSGGLLKKNVSVANVGRTAVFRVAKKWREGALSRLEIDVIVRECIRS